jgi:hypothetical protein
MSGEIKNGIKLKICKPFQIRLLLAFFLYIETKSFTKGRHHPILRNFDQFIFKPKPFYFE